MLLSAPHIIRASRLTVPSLRRALHGGPNVEFGQALKDPAHPTGLWYHPIKQQHDSLPPAWAVSILPDTPKTTDSTSAMGILTPKFPYARESSADQEVRPTDVAASDPDAFRPNPAFFTWLHNTLKEQVIPNDALIDFEASQRESGWLHLADARHGLMPGRIPTPDNILATVAFVDSKLHPETYEVNAMYRPLNAEEGWMQLREEWLEVLLPQLKELL